MVKFLDCEIQMPLLKLPVRTMVATLKDAVVLLSPGSKLTDEQLRSAGDVTDIVAPNLLHAGGIAQAHRVFPKARVWGPPGARTAKPHLPWTNDLTDWTFQDQLYAIPIRGMPQFNEFVFFEPQSGTLFVADLFFNLQQSKGLGAWILLHLFGTWRKFGISRLYLKAVKDRSAFASSVKALLELPIRSLVVAHGESIDSDIVNRMKRAFVERKI